LSLTAIFTRFIVLAETITGTIVAIDFIGKYSSLFLSTDTCVSRTVEVLFQYEECHLITLTSKEVPDSPVLWVMGVEREL